jgi:anti-anti-sigma regulatory factor
VDASRTDGAQRDHDASGIPSDAGAAAVATRIGATWIVTLPRELSDATLASLRGDVVARLTRARAHAIVFEASGLDTIDAAEFADLSTVARTAAWLGMRPMLVGLSAGIVAYLVNAGVDTSAFEPYGTLDDALATVAAAAGARGTPDEPEATP